MRAFSKRRFDSLLVNLISAHTEIILPLEFFQGVTSDQITCVKSWQLGVFNVQHRSLVLSQVQLFELGFLKIDSLVLSGSLLGSSCQRSLLQGRGRVPLDSLRSNSQRRDHFSIEILVRSSEVVLQGQFLLDF